MLQAGGAGTQEDLENFHAGAVDNTFFGEDEDDEDGGHQRAQEAKKEKRDEDEDEDDGGLNRGSTEVDVDDDLDVPVVKDTIKIQQQVQKSKKGNKLPSTTSTSSRTKRTDSNGSQTNLKPSKDSVGGGGGEDEEDQEQEEIQTSSKGGRLSKEKTIQKVTEREKIGKKPIASAVEDSTEDNEEPVRRKLSQEKDKLRSKSTDKLGVKTNLQKKAKSFDVSEEEEAPEPLDTEPETNPMMTGYESDVSLGDELVDTHPTVTDKEKGRVSSPSSTTSPSSRGKMKARKSSSLRHDDDNVRGSPASSEDTKKIKK